MTVLREAHLYAVQRITAVIMAPLVLGHVILIIFAVQDGITAEEILARTRGSLFWAAYYGLFVICAALHAAIGLRAVAAEWLGFSGPLAGWTAAGIAALLSALGLRAVAAVI